MPSREKASTFASGGFFVSMKNIPAQCPPAKSLAVSYQWDGRRSCPTVRIRGGTLKEIGCSVGSRVSVTVDVTDGSIILRRIISPLTAAALRLPGEAP